VAKKLFADTRVFPKQTGDSLIDNLRYSTHSAVHSDQREIKVDWKARRARLLHRAVFAGSQDSQGYNSYLLAFPAFRTAPVQHGVINWPTPWVRGW